MLQPRILAVDDDPTILNLIEDVLTEEYVVRATNNPREALALLNEEEFDLLLIDLGMPEMDGPEVIRQVRARPHLQSLPIVAVSAFTELWRRVADLDVQATVRKPFHLDQLYKTLDKVLTQQQTKCAVARGA